MLKKNMHAVTINGCGSFVAAYFDETYREFKTACIVIECTIRENRERKRYGEKEGQTETKSEGNIF